MHLKTQSWFYALGWKLKDKQVYNIHINKFVSHELFSINHYKTYALHTSAYNVLCLSRSPICIMGEKQEAKHGDSFIVYY